jgi:hypothetical protein
LNALLNEWIVVQEGQYRYLTSDDVTGYTVRFCIGEFLACQATWARDDIPAADENPTAADKDLPTKSP